MLKIVFKVTQVKILCQIYKISMEWITSKTGFVAICYTSEVIDKWIEKNQRALSTYSGITQDTYIDINQVLVVNSIVDVATVNGNINLLLHCGKI